MEKFVEDPLFKELNVGQFRSLPVWLQCLQVQSRGGKRNS
jgi:hypothetical protein